VPQYADLEISLHRREGDAYIVEIRFRQPDGKMGFASAQAQFDVKALAALLPDAVAYGRALTGSLLADPAAQLAFVQAYAVAQAQKPPQGLRVRLFVGPSALALHNLYWETLCDPQTQQPLFTGERVIFSRYLSSDQMQAVTLRPRGSLKALICVANPSDLATYHLAPVDTAGEVQRAKEALGTIPATVLGLAENGQRATLNNLMEQLRAGCDVVYLVCHGSLRGAEPWLWLEDDQGSHHRVSGTQFVAQLHGIQPGPGLMVLASCESAGEGEGVLAALGPRLVMGGIPTVVAMQGQITMDTVAKFMPTFFKELQRDGQIERALAVARGAVPDRPDAWMPALFTQLEHSSLWESVPAGILRLLREAPATSPLSPDELAKKLKVSRKVVEAHLDDLRTQNRVTCETRRIRGSLIDTFYAINLDVKN
jgi:hypothetical protein